MQGKTSDMVHTGRAYSFRCALRKQKDPVLPSFKLLLFLYLYSVGTHGYMAPEVLSKGTAYDSSADWFSFGCMLYKLLKGHSPFRQHKTKDKHEIDRMTLTMNVELPDTFSLALRQLLEGLLQVRNAE